MRPELVIFDVDGLMLDTEARWQQAWQEVGLKHGISDLGYTTFLRCVGRNGKEVERIVVEDLNSSQQAEMILEEATASASIFNSGYSKSLLPMKY